jgi:hypothetical protein
LEPKPGTPEWETYSKRCWAQWKCEIEEAKKQKKAECKCVWEKTDHKGNKYNDIEPSGKGQITQAECLSYCQGVAGTRKLVKIIWDDDWIDVD